MTRRAKLLLLGAAVLFLAGWLLPPVVQGYHFGCDVLAGDNQREVRLGIEFCRQAPTSAPATVATPTFTSPTTQPIAVPTSTAPQPSCPTGYRMSSFGDCLDERHLPCPAGYTGWQNTRLDNCLQKPS